jgi:Type II site-specific deoxyribonuclease
MEPIEQLEQVVRDLNPVQIMLLLEMARAMITEINQYINQSSDLLTSEFATNFSNRLVIHHATHAEKFGKKAFEYAFASASMSAGRTTTIVSSQTNPGTDVLVDGVAFSLKTEASAGLKVDKITISKLMEARWIRDCKTSADFASEVGTRIVGHLQQYQRILILRAYDVSQSEVRYDLVEIPRNLLLQISKLNADDFTDQTLSGGSRANVYVGGRKAFVLRLDGSVEKVTISGLATDMCLDHGSWIIPTLR